MTAFAFAANSKRKNERNTQGRLGICLGSDNRCSVRGEVLSPQSVTASAELCKPDCTRDVVAFAELAGEGVEIETVVRVRRIV